MHGRYHRTITRAALEPYFGPAALKETVAANMAQDTLPNLLGSRPHLHFENDRFAESLAYIEQQQEIIRAAAGDPQGGPAQRAALGRLTHTAQDFYAHSNYVDLWLATQGGLERTRPHEIDGLDPDLLHHPELRTGHFSLWQAVYYVPLLGSLVRRLYLPPRSHEAVHLDHPGRGPRYPET